MTTWANESPRMVKVQIGDKILDTAERHRDTEKGKKSQHSNAFRVWVIPKCHAFLRFSLYLRVSVQM